MQFVGKDNHFLGFDATFPDIFYVLFKTPENPLKR